MEVLRSLDVHRRLELPTGSMLAEAVAQEVEAAEAVDVHAHCFAAEYGEKLVAFGVDKLLTAGYGDPDLACSPDLVAQYLAVADDSPEAFAQLPLATQAERVWHTLFVERSPISEACLGVVSTLQALGLGEALEKRDLAAIRRWYATQDGAKFNEKALAIAKLRYVISSHSPFFSSVQLGACLQPPAATPRYKPALEVDSLLEGDWARVVATGRSQGAARSVGWPTSSSDASGPPPRLCLLVDPAHVCVRAAAAAARPSARGMASDRFVGGWHGRPRRRGG